MANSSDSNRLFKSLHLKCVCCSVTNRPTNQVSDILDDRCYMESYITAAEKVTFPHSVSNGQRYRWANIWNIRQIYFLINETPTPRRKWWRALTLMDLNLTLPNLILSETVGLMVTSAYTQRLGVRATFDTDQRGMSNIHNEKINLLNIIDCF